ncbi:MULTISPECIES: arginine--tRNA ligase [unclassified Chelatococcus]|uniref:arginine--tRNA ligase n=1 Tax=unclassified Chelatococcus TaxID=2638111 RepID=UPI001BCCFB42|nr:MULTISPECIES: arginine--tRNA ligase [unclassified Chelatococcus]CAH1669947.1 Arginine--tRNA ligase [Hyphomicrobiales bacterium]MBS7738274.1 arginine--tRNA ligase [Chelatococcus sp. HY11]MBX3545802.1 arginine--tRNA ligase [Chelatococcus sp.]MCO5077380.1 arginine--tRNA ligase [Chelatococcus sp.]CAH1677816.1 Arginine--tRNA ligase [Hyphomicrobiales bacterium]
MNIFDLYQRHLSAIIEDLVASGRLAGGLDLSRVVVEPPRDASMGDLATNAAMVLAKDAKTNPRALAELLSEALKAVPGVAGVAVAGPGFINLTLEPGVYHDVMRAVLADGADFGRGTTGPAAPVNVEYVSANPTGPMHVGHGRGAVFGDALANVLAFAGRQVTREYYINDAGGQIDVLARSAYLRYREALGQDIGEIPEGLYPGDYLKPVGAELAARFGDALLSKPEAESLPVVRDIAIEGMMAMIRDDLAALGIHHDVFFSERTLHGANGGAIKAAIDELTQRGFVYRGRVPPPKGQLPEDWEDREQLLFRATDVGDDIDRPLMKSNGSYTYFAADVAYLENKHARGFRELIYVLGADHGGYVKRLQAVGRAIGGTETEVIVLLCQLVRLLRDGEPVKMSKRSGDFVTLREVIDEVGRDAVRFMMLFRKNDATLDFDLAKVVEQSKDNPVFYVQYAHARCASVFRQAAEALSGVSMAGEALASADFSRLNDDSEVEILRRLAQYPRVVQASAASHEPHRVAFFLYELASAFHSLWNRGKDSPQLRFINADDRDLTTARLGLVLAVRSVLASGLAILGVAAPDEMR